MHSELLSSTSVPPDAGGSVVSPFAELLDAFEALEKFEMLDATSSRASRASRAKRLKCGLTMPSESKATSCPSRIRLRVDMLWAKRCERCRSKGALCPPTSGHKLLSAVQGCTGGLAAGSTFSSRARAAHCT